MRRVGGIAQSHTAEPLASMSSAAQARVLCEAVELMNTASLIHDDVFDGDGLRRGQPSVWAAYGSTVAIISGMYGYLGGLQRLAELGNVDVLSAGLESLEALHIGQHLDVSVSDGSVLPTLEEYRLIAQANTGCFFVFLLNACQCLKPVDEALYLALKALLYELAVYYRYVNDYCDVNHIPHFEKKGFATDLEGGPKSFLMILAGQPLAKGKRSSEQKNEIVRAFGDAGVLDRASALMDATYKQLIEHLLVIGQHCAKPRLKRLEVFIRDIHFQPGPDDDYYKRVLK
ncbi:polyprenyl synthetase family protein [Pseudomonas sp. FP2309]|uniref:polyprenyl synthetase family protein n=1 Tax=Pseudomonas sp. FP2309 TaxID=2954091 RepID=UPI00273699B9|nr:polyprenyl synthetase family protein [Pseudomonas sp. FP2309]WLH71044.1 polyprenyl synthetase family protein [Pseudomonas sp. FP2309]